MMKQPLFINDNSFSMEDRQQVFSLYIDNASYASGVVDITELLYKQIDKEKIDSIKYVMHTATEKGVYYTVVVLKKKEEVQKGILGFSRQEKEG